MSFLIGGSPSHHGLTYTKSMDVMVIRSHPCDTMDAKGWKGVCQQSSIIQIGMDLKGYTQIT